MTNKSLMIVAHPDDEIIFGYSKLIQGSWHVVCVTNGDHPTRSREFQKVMFALGHSFEIWNFPDVWNGSFDLIKLSDQIAKVLENSFDAVVTHGPEGEYGHTQHQELFKIVSLLVTRNLFVFDPSETALPVEILKAKQEYLKLYVTEARKGLFEQKHIKKFVAHEGLKKIN